MFLISALTTLREGILVIGQAILKNISKEKRSCRFLKIFPEFLTDARQL